MVRGFVIATFDWANRNGQTALVNESFQGKGRVRRASCSRVTAVVLVASLASLCACASGDGETTTDEPGGSGAGGGAAGTAGGTGGSADGGTGGTSSGGTGGTSAGGTGGSSSGGTGGTGGSGGTSSGGTGGTSAGGTAGSGGVCDQADWEPNDSELAARPLLDISDCDDQGGTVGGTLAPGDVDWFTFKASDTALCSINPYVNLTTSDNVTVCMFFKCDGGTTEVTCPAGSQDWSSNPAHPGCCASLTPLEPSINCGGTLSETAEIWLQVSWMGNTSCRSYSLDYHY